MRYRVLSALIFSSLPAFAQQTTDLAAWCNAGSGGALAAVSEELVGNYQVQVVSGRTEMGGRSIPLPSTSYPATIFSADGALSISIESGDLRGTAIDLEFETEGGWSMGQLEGGAPMLTDEDLSLALDCDVDSYPRLHGTAPFQSSVGPADMTVRLWAISSELLYGVFRADAANGLVVLEAVSLQR